MSNPKPASLTRIQNEPAYGQAVQDEAQRLLRCGDPLGETKNLAGVVGATSEGGETMKCTTCHAAEPVIKYSDEVPYWYKGRMTSINGVSLYTCLHCGAESIPPGRVQEWLKQTAAFRAVIDAQESGQGTRPALREP